jgi:hypothetical protein
VDVMGASAPRYESNRNTTTVTNSTMTLKVCFNATEERCVPASESSHRVNSTPRMFSYPHRSLVIPHLPVSWRDGLCFCSYLRISG